MIVGLFLVNLILPSTDSRIIPVSYTHLTDGKEIVKVIVIKGKIVNIVVK